MMRNKVRIKYTEIDAIWKLDVICLFGGFGWLSQIASLSNGMNGL